MKHRIRKKTKRKKGTEKGELSPELKVRVRPSYFMSMHLPWASVKCVLVIFNMDGIPLEGTPLLKDWAQDKKDSQFHYYCSGYPWANPITFVPQPLHSLQELEKISSFSQGISEPKFNILFPRNLEASSWLQTCFRTAKMSWPVLNIKGPTLPRLNTVIPLDGLKMKQISPR